MGRRSLLLAATAIAALALLAASPASEAPAYVWRMLRARESFDWGEVPPWGLFNLVQALGTVWLPRLHAALVPPHLHAVQLATGFVSAKSLYAATALGIADLLEGGPLPVSQLAERAGVKEDGLGRVLRLLEAHGIFREVSPGVFANNRGSSVLRKDHPASLHNMLTVWGDESYWAHERLLDSLRPGSPPAFELQSGGLSYWRWLSQEGNERRSAVFNRAMEDASRSLNAATLADYDWHRHANHTISDVGGGIGSFLAALLAAQPSMRGLLVDRPPVVADAVEHWRQHHHGLLRRVSMLASDFFKELPPADVHFLRYILHDWDDEHAAAILRVLRAAVQPGAEAATTLLVQDVVLPERNPGMLYSALDLQASLRLLMLAMTGGRERTLPQWRELLASGGWRLVAVHPLRTVSAIIEGRPA